MKLIVKEIEVDAEAVRNIFRGGAKATTEYLTNEEIDSFLGMLSNCHPDGICIESLNGIFKHSRDFIAEWLGFNSFDEIMKRNKK